MTPSQVDLTRYGFAPPQQQTTSQPQSSGGGFLHTLLNIVKSAAQPITSTVASGFRGAESVPSLVREGAALVTGNKAGAAAADKQAAEIQNKPLFGAPTFPSMNVKELAGSAAKTASLGLPGVSELGPAAEGAVAGGLFGAGEAAQQNQSGKQIVESGAVGAAGGAVGGKILSKVGDIASRLFGKGAQVLDTEGNPLSSEAKDALEAIQTKLSKADQAEAAAQGRATIKGAGAKIEYQPDAADLRVAKTLEPLVKSGDVVAPTKPEDYLNNITAVQRELDKSTTALRAGLQDINEQVWKPQELTQRVFDAHVPLSIKGNTSTIQNLQGAVLQLADETPKTPEGLLDLRQEFDTMIRHEYPNLYDRENTPIRQYVKSLRDNLNAFAESKLPEGKLPSGITYTDELRRQSALINAKEAMGEKIAQDLPENSTAFTRWVRANPEKARLLRRIVIGSAVTATGIYGAARALNKAVSQP